MKLLMTTLVMAVAAVAQAAQMPPAPEPALTPMPSYETMATVSPSSTPVELFQCVKYKDLKNVHPCAVPMIVSVPDPCADDCSCTKSCVYVQVCVPPCECYTTKCRRKGNKVILDFGNYEVEVTSARGAVVVDYDD